ncbi:Hypothetical protein ORPV_140 [Orpheovirus IHUMI-LCC2]|uniref:Uncharacterized protein n=1 Tax=Orpheovirus IHUMI-LCC2 TaxID=2023057 RepID=A0A2I2L3D7_9VIRU|nr:Hypothetical protein ORPV_140 [Orpheovirus IHUMI-LCC2]SNW62044.1 Hypothetical protein ORPV_140 [Orpheovirus IHUMI-LCC2]
MYSLQGHALLNYVGNCKDEDELKCLKKKIKEQLGLVKERKLLDKILPDGDVYNEALKNKVVSFERVTYESYGKIGVKYYITFEGGHIIHLNKFYDYSLTRLLHKDGGTSVNGTIATSTTATKGGDPPMVYIYVLLDEDILPFIRDIGLENESLYVEKMRDLLIGYINEYKDVNYGVVTQDEYINSYHGLLKIK